MSPDANQKNTPHECERYMDQRKWGPPGWSLLHRVAVNAARNPEVHGASSRVIANNLQYVLPCKYCRKHTGKFVRQNKNRRYGPSEFIENLHSAVNARLGKESNHAFNRRKPGDARDFVMSIARNYPANPDGVSDNRIRKTRRFLSAVGRQTGNSALALLQPKHFTSRRKLFGACRKCYGVSSSEARKYDLWVAKKKKSRVRK